MNYDIDIPAPTEIAPYTLGGGVRIELGADHAAFHAGFTLNMLYTMERRGEMLRITGRKPGPFNSRCAFTIDLPVEAVREVIEGEQEERMEDRG